MDDTKLYDIGGRRPAASALAWRLAVLVAGLLALAACQSLVPPRPMLAWDPAPKTVVIDAYDSGGMVPYSWELNNLPLARVYGDGRIVWVVRDGSRREVFVGRLSADEVQALLEQIAATGFFGWDDFYEAEALVYDAGTTTLRVNLLDTSQSVSGYFNGAPPKFYELLRTLSQGAGAAGERYVPETGYVQAIPAVGNGLAPELHWPAEEVGFGLDQAIEGRFVDGAALAAAWALVTTSQAPLVESEGLAYELVVQVPGLSVAGPSAP